MSKNIFVNFVKDNSFGCDQHCPFCEWSKQNFNIYYCPTKADLELFNTKFKDTEKWQISGGGDPLYNFEENWPKLKELIDTIHSLGHTVQILTKRIDIVNKYFNLLKDYVDYWYFSVGPTVSTDLVSVSKKLGFQATYVNTVLNPIFAEINWPVIENIIKQYDPYVAKISFRCNFIIPIKEDIHTIRKKLKQISPKAILIPNANNSEVLFLGQILTCQEIDNKYLKTSSKE